MRPLTPMLKAHSNAWYDETCDDGWTCLITVPDPKVVPGETDRHVIVLFHLPGNLYLDNNSEKFTNYKLCNPY